MESEIRLDVQQQLRSYLERGDAFPETILPGSEPLLPKPSAKIDLQLDESIGDEEITVEQARQQAAQMQAQMDQAVAEADARRAEQ